MHPSEQIQSLSQSHLLSLRFFLQFPDHETKEDGESDQQTEDFASSSQPFIVYPRQRIILPLCLFHFLSLFFSTSLQYYGVFIVLSFSSNFS